MATRRTVDFAPFTVKTSGLVSHPVTNANAGM